LYGVKRGQADGMGLAVLVARRMAEQGVRFVEIADCSSSNNWDQHGDMGEHAKHAKDLDQPVAGLLRDLKQRGMLDDTLVYGRLNSGARPAWTAPKAAATTARVFIVLAGAGVKAGLTYGSTDEIARPSRRTKFTCTISTRRSCISSASITPNSRTVLAGAISVDGCVWECGEDVLQ